MQYIISGSSGAFSYSQTTPLEDLQNTMENYSVTLEGSIEDSVIASLYPEMVKVTDEGVVLSGTMYDVQSALENIKSLSSKMSLSKGFTKSLEDAKSNIDAYIDAYGELHNQTVYYEQIEPNETYKAYYDDIEFKKVAYDTAIEGGDRKTIEDAKNDLLTSISTAIKNTSSSVQDYFEQMYPKLTNELNVFDFENALKINSSINRKGLVGQYSVGINDALSKDLQTLQEYSIEDLKSFDYNTETFDKKQALSNLQAIANQYFQGNIDSLLSYLNDIGKVFTEEQQTVLEQIPKEYWDKYSDEEKGYILKDSEMQKRIRQFNQKSKDKNDWINSLTGGDIEQESQLREYYKAYSEATDTGNEEVANEYLELFKEFVANKGIDVNSLIEALSYSEEEFHEWLKRQIKEGTSKSKKNYSSLFEEINKAYSKLKDGADIVFSANEEIESNGKVSLDTLTKMVELYPELNEAAYRYRLGLISEEELFAELESAYNSDRDEYLAELKAKTEADDIYWNSMKDKYPEVFDKLKTLYSDDFKSWKNLTQAKTELQTTFLKLLEDEQNAVFSQKNNLLNKYGIDLDRYAKLIKDETTGLYKIDTSVFDGGSFTNDADDAEGLELAFKEYLDKIQAEADRYNKAIEELNKLVYDPTDIQKEDSKWENVSDKGSSSTDSWKEEFNTYFATLKHMLEMDEITQAQYYATLDSLNQKYFANREEYLDEYRQYEEEVYKGLRGLQSDAISDIKDLRDMTIDMIKQTMEAEIEALEEKREKFNEEIEARKEIIELMKDEADHEEELNEKNKAVTDIQLQIDALKYDNSAAAQKKLRELQEELVDAQKELSDYITDYEYEQEIERLDKEAEAYDEKTQAEIDKIQELLDNEEYLIKEANRMMQEESDTLYDRLISWNKEFGSTIDADVRDKWEKAQTALGNFKGELETVAELYERLKETEVDNKLTDSNIMNQIVNVPGKTGTNSGSNTTGSGSGTGTDNKDTTPTTSNTSNKKPKEHIVQKGESLWSIARDYYGQGTEWEKIRDYNNIDDSNLIVPGQKLIIPFKTGGYTGNDEGLAYLHQKELVLNEHQTQPVLEALPKLANVLPNLQELIDMGSYLVQKSFNPISTPAFAGIQPQNIISIGDININGNMGDLTMADLNKFRKDIVNDVFTSINKSRLKSGR